MKPASIISALLLTIAWLGCASATYPPGDPRYYDMGAPILSDLWVDPVNGNDNASGATRAQALRTVREAWGRIPIGITLAGTGYRIMLAAGTYSPEAAPSFWEARYGTYAYPIIIQAADGAGTALMPSMNFFDCRYLYLIGLTIEADGGDVLHFASCDHVLVRQTQVVGSDPETYNVQEALKINQS
ncbi:MAG: hypothetical protein HY335_08595, partial [Deinococcus sp.]|nr:hypothetical protein [Deinococcus sp.]